MARGGAPSSARSPHSLCHPRLAASAEGQPAAARPCLCRCPRRCPCPCRCPGTRLGAERRAGAGSAGTDNPEEPRGIINSVTSTQDPDLSARKRGCDRETLPARRMSRRVSDGAMTAAGWGEALLMRRRPRRVPLRTPRAGRGDNRVLLPSAGDIERDVLPPSKNSPRPRETPASARRLPPGFTPSVPLRPCTLSGETAQRWLQRRTAREGLVAYI